MALFSTSFLGTWYLHLFSLHWIQVKCVQPQFENSNQYCTIKLLSDLRTDHNLNIIHSKIVVDSSLYFYEMLCCMHCNSEVL